MKINKGKNKISLKWIKIADLELKCAKLIIVSDVAKFLGLREKYWNIDQRIIKISLLKIIKNKHNKLHKKSYIHNLIIRKKSWVL